MLRSRTVAADVVAAAVLEGPVFSIEKFRAVEFRHLQK